jgi:hypothetical protein
MHLPCSLDRVAPSRVLRITAQENEQYHRYNIIHEKMAALKCDDNDLEIEEKSNKGHPKPVRSDCGIVEVRQGSDISREEASIAFTGMK